MKCPDCNDNLIQIDSEESCNEVLFHCYCGFLMVEKPNETMTRVDYIIIKHGRRR